MGIDIGNGDSETVIVNMVSGVSPGFRNFLHDHPGLQ